MATSWALTGRDEELRFGLARLRGSGGGGLVLSGAAGVGKSRLAQELAARVGAGWCIQRAVATPSASTIPLGAFSHLLDDGLPLERHALEARDLAWALGAVRRSLAAAAGTDRPLLVVDDAHVLDQASAALVHQVATSGEAHVLLTVRTGEPLPDSVAALLADPSVDRLELQALSLAEVGELAAGALGAWLEQDSVERLHRASGGNPLFLRELLADAEAGGLLSVHRGLVRWRGVTATPRLSSLVARDLDRAGPEAGHLVDAMALGEPVPVAAARRMVDPSVLAGLERVGVVEVDGLGDGQVRLAHPLFGEVRRAQMGPLRRAEVATRLAAAFEAAGCHHPDDRMRVVTWLLEAGGTVAPLELVDAAAHARSRGDDGRAEALVRRALTSAAVPEGELLLAEILEATGRPVEAADRLDGLAERLASDRDRARALVVQLRVVTHGLHRPAEAERVAKAAADIGDPVWRGFVEAQWATLVAMLGRLDEAAPLAAALAAHPDERVRLRALPAVNLVAYAAGRPLAAHAAASALVGPALEHRASVPTGLAVVFSALAIDLLALGRLSELDDLLALAAAPVARSGANRPYLLLVEGTLALRRGRVAAARRALTESVELFTTADPQGYRPTALALLVQAAALAGDRDAAHLADQEYRAALAGRPARLIDHDGERARAWLPVAEGAPGRARQRLVDLAGRAREAQLVLLEADCLHDAVRLGAGARAQARLAVVAGAVEGDRAAAVAAHAAALRTGEARALETVAERFEALGEDLVAAELFSRAARRFREQGVEGGSRRAARRAHAAAGRCDGAVAPVDEVPAPVSLTPRELQVARLAAAGTSSPDIAATLAVSRRTVDNQLGRVYAKLGVGGRADLAAALAHLPDPDPMDPDPRSMSR
jgi:DNA-binding CsgD family transcriptional regulator